MSDEAGLGQPIPPHLRDPAAVVRESRPSDDRDGDAEERADWRDALTRDEREEGSWWLE